MAEITVPCLRVSVHGYNTRADIEQLLDALKTLLPRGRANRHTGPLVKSPRL